MDISEACFKGMKSIVMENSGIRLEVLPKGGRIVSLIDKRNGREFLVQQKGEVYRSGVYDSNMVDYEPAGFDDMFPTINECYYEDFPWKGHRMPDHGELWSLGWKYEIKESSVFMWAYGVRLPYLFRKTISFTDHNQIYIDYRISNLTEFDMYFLWTAHPMLKAEEGLEVCLPDCCNKAVCTLCFDGRLGDYGNTIGWPKMIDNSGKTHRINMLRGLDAKNTEKYYFKDRLTEGWCKIKYPSDNTLLTLEFPADKVPYFGILVEEGGWADELYIIPEPCTAPFDRIDVSKLHNSQSILPANGNYNWFLSVRIQNEST